MPLNSQLLNYYLLSLHWSSLYYVLGCLSYYVFMHVIFILKYFTACQGSLSCWGNIKYDIYFNLQFIRFIILLVIYWMLIFCYNFFKHGLFSLGDTYQIPIHFFSPHKTDMNLPFLVALFYESGNWSTQSRLQDVTQ